MTMAPMTSYRMTASEFLSSSLTVEEYARSHLERVAGRDKDVEAWAYLNEEHILLQARSLDAVPLDRRGPLHGVPIGVKDIMYTKDMPTQHNSLIYANDAPAIDASLISVLRNAGALIFGKTTTTEFACVTTGTKTKNAHDPARTPGGSSSGSGASVGDYQVPLALGTQTIGSIIRPASFNGVFGFKPTFGAISREGVKFGSLNLDTVGFFSRSVADLELLADVCKISDDESPASEFLLAGSKIAVCKSPVWTAAGPGTVKALAQGAQLLRDQGAIVEELTLPGEFDEVTTLHRRIFQRDAGVAYMNEPKEKLDPLLASFVDDIPRLTNRDYLQALDTLAQLRPKLDAITSQFDAILTPSAVDEAPEGLATTGDPIFCGLWTVMHAPVVNVPGFSGENGMPIGLSLVSGRFQDRRLLKVAAPVATAFAPGNRPFQGSADSQRPIS